MAKLEGVKTLDMKDGEITKISYDEAEYVRVKGKPEEGDLMLNTTPEYDTTEGAYYRITEIDSDGDPRYIDDAGDRNGISLTFSGNANLYFRKVSDNKSTPTLAEVSDKVGAIEQRVSALEGEEKERLNIGTYAKVVGGGKRHYLSTGDIVEVLDNNDPGGTQPYFVKRLTDGRTSYLELHQLRKATDEEIAEATAPKFEEGDYVKVLASGEFGGVDVGEYGKVAKGYADEGDRYSVRVDRIDGKKGHDYFRPQDLEKLEGKVVERIGQFAKAGRKLDEFKKGDIISTVNYGIVEVTEIKPEFEHPVRGYFNCAADGMKPEFCTLIAPVESRVDVK